MYWEDGRYRRAPIFSGEEEYYFLPPFDHHGKVHYHTHDEPVTMGLLADKVLKGVKNVDFKYGGSGVELAEVLFKMGLLATDVVTVKNTRIVPMNLVLTLCPPAPKYPEEIKAIIDEGGDFGRRCISGES